MSPRARDLLDRLRTLPAADAVLAAAREAGPADGVYLVGGAVRDLWFDETPRDLDLLVVGELDGLLAALGGRVRAHDRFGTASITAADGTRIDLARARRETYSSPGALPTVTPAGAREDLDRRDFTVSALALGLTGPDAGRLLTVDGAIDDLRARRLRVLHPVSFRDDPTRLLRLARYAARLGFSIDPGTEALARQALADGALTTVSGPRLGAELLLLATDVDPAAGFTRLRSLRIDDALAPGFGLTDPMRLTEALRALPGDGDRIGLGLGLAGSGLEPERLAELLARLGIPAGHRDVALSVAGPAGEEGGVEALIERVRAAERPSAVAAVLERVPIEACAVLATLAPAGVGGRVREWLSAWRHTRATITGDDLIAAGVSPGPAIAVGLAAARAARLDGDAVTREAELLLALDAARAVLEAVRDGERGDHPSTHETSAPGAPPGKIDQLLDPPPDLGGK